MKNVLLVLFRHSNKYRKSQVAAKIGIPYKEYVAIENGEEMMSYEIAQQLGKLYSIGGKYFYEAAKHLDLLITRGEVIKHLNDENKRMDALLEGGYELLHSSKQKASSHEKLTDCRPATN